MTREKLATATRVSVIAVLVVFSFGAAGEICGSFFETTAAAFGSKFPDNKAEDVNAVVTGIGSPQPTTKMSNSMGVPLAVMVVEENPKAVVAFDMNSGAEIWKKSLPVRSSLTLNGDVVVFQSGYKVAGHSIKNGQALWDIDIEEGWDYHGADVNGNTAVVSLGVGGKEAGAYANGRVIGLDATSGSKLWDNASGGGLLGTPSVHGNYVFVPWDRQKLTIIDAKEGNEVARIRADDYTINFVEAGPSGVYYGSAPAGDKLTSIFKLDPKAASGTREGSTLFTPQLDPVPGDPMFKSDAFAMPVAGRSAAEKIRFHWLPAPDSANPVGMSDNAYYLHYWRYVIAFDRVSNQVRWTYQSERDIESMKPVPGGLVGVDTAGKLFFVDAGNGQEVWSKDTGYKVLTASFDAAGFRPGNATGAAVDPLIGLKEIIRDNDNRMLPIRAYAAFLMADIPNPEVTKDLLDIYSDSSIPKGLRESVVSALSKRTTGSEYLVKALHMRYDFLEQTQAPPMKVVAPALVNMNDRSAVPGLLSHLMNYETSVDSLREISIAIDKLGDPSVVGTLTQFITLYHADSSFIGHEDALAAAAQGILTHGGQQGEQYVASIRDEFQTLPELKKLLFEILDPEAAAKAKAEAEAAAKAEAEAAAKTEEERAAEEAAKAAANRPRSLSREQIAETIVKNQQVLKPCVQAALGLRPGLRSIRMKFMITGNTGKSSRLQILPGDVPGLKECLDSGLAEIDFPKFKNLRQSATYTIKIQGMAPPTGYGTPGTTQPGTTQPADPDSFGGGGYQQPPAGGQPAPQPTPQPQPQPGQPYDPDAF